MREDFLYNKLMERKAQNAYRQLTLPDDKIDFCSNDYLGIIRNNLLQPGLTNDFNPGSGGSRLLTGNFAGIEAAEMEIATFHDAPCGLLFNSGYNANTSLLSCVPQKGDTILYDKICHASIRDGIRLSFADSMPFLHNNAEDLEQKLKTAKGNIFIVTESVFSMDGDVAPLNDLARLAETYNAHLIIDEAHATGVYGENGQGFVQLYGLQSRCFARMHTFGKACGTHGAIVLGSVNLKEYLVNFARPFIYTTALPPASIATIRASYRRFPEMVKERQHLVELIHHCQQSIAGVQKSVTAIQVLIVPGNTEARKVAAKLQAYGLDVRAILYPTVPLGAERLRIVLHAFNTFEQVSALAQLLND